MRARDGLCIASNLSAFVKGAIARHVFCIFFVMQVVIRPDFTGIWKLLRGESEFGFLPPPLWRLDTIVHNDPHLRIRTRQKDTNGDITLDRDLTIGGPLVTITIRGRERHLRAFWDEAALVMETLSHVSGSQRRIEDRRTLDAAGEWLTIERLHEQPGGAVRQRLRLRRQPRQNSAL